MQASAVNWGNNGTLWCSCHFPTGYDIRLRGLSLTLLKFWSILMLDVQYLAQHDMASSNGQRTLWNHTGWQPKPTWIGNKNSIRSDYLSPENNVPKLVQTFEGCHVTGWIGFSRLGEKVLQIELWSWWYVSACFLSTIPFLTRNRIQMTRQFDTSNDFNEQLHNKTLIRKRSRSPGCWREAERSGGRGKVFFCWWPSMFVWPNGPGFTGFTRKKHWFK